MILPNNNDTSFIEKAINKAFLLYKNDMVDLYQKSWKEEDYNETSTLQFTGSRYLIAIQLAILVYLDYTRYPSLGWSFYVNKFNLNKYSKCFRCEGINFDKILEQFGLPSIGDGVNFQIVEDTLIVENIELDSMINVIDILQIIKEGDNCKIYLEDNCLFESCN